MTSVQNNVKVESPVEDLSMGDTQEAGNGVNEQSESPSSQADDNSSGQNGGTSSGQNGGTSSGQTGGTSSGQNSGTSSGQNGGTSSGQTGGTSSGQNGGTSSGQTGGTSSGQTGGTSSGQNPFYLNGSTKRNVRIPGDEDAAREYRSFSPGVAEPDPKKQKSNNNDMTNFFGKSTQPRNGLFGFKSQSGGANSFSSAPQGQQTTQSPPPPSNNDDEYDDEYDDLRGDLVGSQTPPANMETKGLVVGGKKPSYINMYTVDDRSVFRIESIKSANFDEAKAPVLSNTKYRAGQNPDRWQDVADVLGVATAGDEMDHSDFLSRLDPENPYKFDWNQDVFIILQRTDGKTVFVNRGWWRDNYVPRNRSARKTYNNKKSNGYYYYYKTKDDPELRERQNHNAFQDYRLFKWAFWYERKYYQALHPGQSFVVGGRIKSPSPIDDDIFRFREMTIPRDVDHQSSNIVQSIESPPADSDVEIDTPPQNNSQPQQTSARQPSIRHPTSQRVNPNGSPRPRNSRMFDRMRQPRFTPRQTAMAC